MRRMIDILVVLTAALLLAGVSWRWHRDTELDRRLDAARASVEVIEKQIHLQSALERTEMSPSGYPMTIQPAWFADGPPMNPLLDDGRPWMEIADETERRREHPPDPIALDRDDAQFWYNPHTGRVRARIPATISDAKALRWYNRINDASLANLFVTDAETP